MACRYLIQMQMYGNTVFIGTGQFALNEGQKICKHFLCHIALRRAFQHHGRGIFQSVFQGNPPYFQRRKYMGITVISHCAHISSSLPPERGSLHFELYGHGQEKQNMKRAWEYNPRLIMKMAKTPQQAWKKPAHCGVIIIFVWFV